MPLTTCAGRKVTDKDGKDVGKVHDVFVDDRERKARSLLVEHGGFLGYRRKEVFHSDRRGQPDHQ
jgi:sporulation protein YlmC with PRC-barrel domain